MEPRNPLQTAAAGPFWKPRADCREGGSYVLGRISRDFDDFLRRGPPCGLGAEAAFKAKMGYETQKPAANGCNGSFFGKPRTDCRKGKSTSSEEFRGISTFSSRRDRPGAWERGRFGSKKLLFGKPRAGCREGNLRPRKNFAGFRRFSQTGTALWPRCRGCF